mmetsp:Transcript_71061/g.139623  ORF Transcript_71061/g.139623 Transcript_71061/m.139623 type:complete len:368 (-) Transcript_71061:116-1219(-)
MPPNLPEISAPHAHDSSSRKVAYAKFANTMERREGLVERFNEDFTAPMVDHAAEHQIYMEATVSDFTKKIAHLDKLLRGEKARRTQIGMTFRSFFKDTVLEIQQYGTEQRTLTNQRITERFEETKRRLDELAGRIPREQQEMLDSITEKTEATRKQVDKFLSVDCASESAGCKVRHQVLVDEIGTGAMRVEDDMNVAQKQRQNSMDELRDKLRESSQLASKNANKLQAKLQYELASIKNGLTTETLMRELSDTQLAAMMQRQVAFLMQSAKCVNSTIGIDEVEPVDYATEATLKERQRLLEMQLRSHMRAEQDREAAARQELEEAMADEMNGAEAGDAAGSREDATRTQRSRSDAESGDGGSVKARE